MLFAETAAVLLVTTNLIDFMSLPSTYIYDCFVLYNAIIDDERRELQMYAGRVEIEPNILYDNQYRTNFDDRNGLYLIDNVLCGITINFT